MKKLDRRAALLIGLGLGAAIWLASPLITGRREPWDAEGGYYPAALLGAGVLGGLLAPQHWLSVALGVFGGQAVVLLGGVIAEPARGAMWPLGVLFLGWYSVLALLGAGLGATARRILLAVLLVTVIALPLTAQEPARGLSGLASDSCARIGRVTTSCTRTATSTRSTEVR